MDIESEKSRIQEFVDKGNYHAALNLTVSAINTCRRHDDQAGVDDLIATLRNIVQVLADEFGSHSQQ
jgi:hypothetical protein